MSGCADTYYVYKVNPWVAHRTYTPPSDRPRTVISNEREHEFLGLDGDSSRAWRMLAEEGVGSPHEIAASLGLGLGEVEAFLNELEQAELISIVGNGLGKSRVTSSGRVANLSPPSERYERGSYTEASPGGTNLEAEFEFQDWALSHGFLWSCGWEITYRCNESCVHCFNPGASHSDDQRPQRKTAELVRSEWLKMLDEMKHLGVFRLLLTGGEVALRKDFFEILQEARARGFSVTIFTNGTLFDEPALRKLANSFPHRVELSIYSPIPELHDKVTRLKGSFQQTKAAAVWLADNGITVAVKMAVMPTNISDIEEFRSLCKDWGVESQIDFNMSPGIDGARDPILTLLPPALELIRSAMNPNSPLFAGEAGKPRNHDWSLRKNEPVCGAGRTTMSISPEGHIYPCNSLPIYSGSVKEHGLAAVWRGSDAGQQGLAAPPESTVISDLSTWQSVRGKDYHVCGSFSRCAWCQKCPGMAMLESGDELSPSTTNCRNSAARMIAYDLICAGRSVENMPPEEFSKLQSTYLENSALWDFRGNIAAKISLETLKSKLKERTKATILNKNSPLLGG